MNSPSIDRRMVLMAFAAMFGLIACQAPNSARGVVDRFIAAHYMAIDLKAAEQLLEFVDAPERTCRTLSCSSWR